MLAAAVLTDIDNRLADGLFRNGHGRRQKGGYSVFTFVFCNFPERLGVTGGVVAANCTMIDNQTDEGVCIIDLDTIMPGSPLYDFGDSIRFGASSAAEDEKDLNKVFMKLDLFESYTKGFLSEVGSALTESELSHLAFSAKLMTLECGMRFLADFLDGDFYFATHYDGQNLDRARTQFKLVADMESKMNQMQAVVAKYR